MNFLFSMPGGPELIVILLVLLLLFTPFVLTLIALIDCLKNKFNGSEKVVWVLVIIFFPFIGSILYLTIGKKNAIK